MCVIIETIKRCTASELDTHRCQYETGARYPSLLLELRLRLHLFSPCAVRGKPAHGATVLELESHGCISKREGRIFGRHMTASAHEIEPWRHEVSRIDSH
jgi:hypothetical protein